MTPAELGELRKRLGADPERHKEWAMARYKEMRAVVRCMCGYTPEVLRGLSWEELRQAYMDCRLVKELGGTR